MPKFYITTSIPYVNAPPHVGHALEFLQTDAIARYHRLKQDDVLFLSGTDDNALKIGRAAEAAGKRFKAFVDENAERFNALISDLQISNDDFIRTSDEQRHWPGAQELWRKLDEAGDIYKATYKGLYCVGHEMFVTEKELVNGVCPDHGKAPEVIEEENYFFRLSKYGDAIKKLIESNELEIVPKFRANEMLSFVKEGLEDVSFSRPSKDIPWGVPVPGDPTQSMYVWCDALSNYITALGYGSSDSAKFEKYWPAEAHVIGKDIQRFHALIWIGMLLSAKIPTPRRILVHGFIVSGGKKMSKTLGNVIDPVELVEKYGTDPVRLFLLKEIPTFEDGDLTVERFEEAYNANLSNGLGNLVSRTLKMAEMYFQNNVQRPTEEVLVTVPVKSSYSIMKAVDATVELDVGSVADVIERHVLPEYEKLMGEFRLHEAANVVWQLIGLLDKYIQEYEPFKLVKTDKEKTQAVLYELLGGLETIAYMLQPFVPDTAKKINDALGISEFNIEERAGYTVKGTPALFPRLETHSPLK